MVVWCSPEDDTMQQQDERLLSCTHKTTEQNATMQTKYSEETSYTCEGQWCVCITRPNYANIAMILAGTSSQSRKHHVNQTRVQVSSRNPGGVVCFRHGTVRQNVAVFNTKTMTGSVTKTHVDGIHHANHHLSKKASQILVVWCSSQKHTVRM